MSIVTLATAKANLRVIHNADDLLLQSLLDGAESEAKRFLNRDELPGLAYSLPLATDTETAPADEAAMAPEVVTAVCLLVRAQYDETDPARMKAWRSAAETLLMPYRTDMGV